MFYKMLVLLKNHLNYLKDIVLECFLRSIMDLYILFFLKHSQHIMMENLSPEQ